jgi:hypothetical protein
VLEAAVGRGALLVSEHADALAAEAAEAADDGGVLAVFAIAGQPLEVGDQVPHIVQAVRALGVAGDLGLLPGRELGIEVLERLRGLGLEAGNLLADGGRAVAARECAQLLHLGVELGHRLFEVEVAAHQVALSSPATLSAKCSDDAVPRDRRGRFELQTSGRL